MEMLAVILVIAVVVSMAAPVFRSVRYEMKNSQAKAAAKKMAEAIKSYYQANRGQKINAANACFTPSTLTILTTCSSSAGATGIPGQSVLPVNVEELFSCGYLSWKDFESLPYKFCANYTTSAPEGFAKLPTGAAKGKVWVFAGGLDGAGPKYQQSKGYIFVDNTLTVKDTY